MEHIGAGLAAIGVIGPGIGIGILAGLSSQAIGRNPDAAGQIRGLAIILAAFAEGLGVLAIVVGLIELMLEFVKPVTLSMRLFGNIYGGEVALGVISSLTIVLLPVALIGLELMLNAIQALIFSVLTLIFITLAIESHHEEEGHIAEEVVAQIEGAAAA